MSEMPDGTKAQAQSELDAMEREVTTLRRLLITWAVRVAVLSAVLWSYILASGDQPSWVWPAIGIYASVSLVLAFIMRAIHARVVAKSRARIIAVLDAAPDTHEEAEQ